MRQLLILCLSLLSVLPLSAQTTAREWLGSLNTSLGNRYATTLVVRMGDSADGTLSGYLMIDGDGYYLTLGAMEVYSDGKLRYEINNERKEVTEDRVNLESSDLLTNPTRAFDFVDEQFEVSVKSSNMQGAELYVVPRDENMGISDITLSLVKTKSGVQPKRIVYDYDGEVVTIELTMVDTSDNRLPRWDKSSYRAYDIVSFL